MLSFYANQSLVEAVHKGIDDRILGRPIVEFGVDALVCGNRETDQLECCEPM